MRKRLKNVDPKLTDYTEKYDQIFTKIQNISYDFVKEIDKGVVENFNGLFSKHNDQIKEFGSEIPTLRKKIRKFSNIFNRFTSFFEYFQSFSNVFECFQTFLHSILRF